MAQDKKSEFALTDEQVQNWRELLVTLPLPPAMMALGTFALIMSRGMVVRVVEQVQERLKEGPEWERQKYCNLLIQEIILNDEAKKISE